jgi:hypothetical protein
MDASGHSGNDGVSAGATLADIAGDALRMQERLAAMAQRRAQARRSGAEHERSMARQRASQQAEHHNATVESRREKEEEDAHRQSRLQEEQHTTRKERVGSLPDDFVLPAIALLCLTCVLLLRLLLDGLCPQLAHWDVRARTFVGGKAVREAQDAQEQYKRLLHQKQELDAQRRCDEQARYVAGMHQRLIDRFRVRPPPRPTILAQPP